MTQDTLEFSQAPRIRKPSYLEKLFIQVVLILLATVLFSSASQANAEREKAVQQVSRVFEVVKLRSCYGYRPQERSECERTQLLLGYLSWGLTLAAHGFDVTARITKGDLGALREFVDNAANHETQAYAIEAFLSEPTGLCMSPNCAGYLGISVEELYVLSSDIDHARHALACLRSWQDSEQARDGRVNDAGLLTHIEWMQRGLVAPCSPISRGSESILRRAFRN